MEPLSKVFLSRNQALAAEEGDFVGGGGSQRKNAQVRWGESGNSFCVCTRLFPLISTPKSRISYLLLPSSLPQPASPSDMEGSLWWHRNFAKGDDALFNAQWELIEYVLGA